MACYRFNIFWAFTNKCSENNVPHKANRLATSSTIVMVIGRAKCSVVFLTKISLTELYRMSSLSSSLLVSIYLRMLSMWYSGSLMMTTKPTTKIMLIIAKTEKIAAVTDFNWQQQVMLSLFCH